jgi:hypothetical protein
MTDDVDDIIDDEASLDAEDEIDPGDAGDAFLGDDADDDADDDAEDAVESAVDDDDDDEDDAKQESGLSLDASEDGDDEIGDDPVVDLAILDQLGAEDEGDDGDDPDDGVRDGEFICRSCHMAKRSSALADADEQLCRDCV